MAKRGLPHAHILLWLKDKVYASQINSIISAEFPDPEHDPQLFANVKSYMIDGPCGSLNPQCKCMPQDLFYITHRQVTMVILYTEEEEVLNNLGFRLNFRLEVDQSQLITNGLSNTILCFQKRLMLILTSNFAPASNQSRMCASTSIKVQIWHHTTFSHKVI